MIKLREGLNVAFTAVAVHIHVRVHCTCVSLTQYTRHMVPYIYIQVPIKYL